MLNIALLGACPAGLSELAAGLEKTLHALERQTMRVMVAGAGAMPAGLPGFDLVLLAGLETPLKTGTDISLAPDLQAADQAIRTALARAGVSYQVLYGTAGERMAQALQAAESLLPADSRPRPAVRPVEAKKQPWVWMCDKCSDPQCEHQLLTALLARRDSAA